MGIAAFAFLVIFLLIASGGLLLFYRQALLQRISGVITPQAVSERSFSSSVRDTRTSLAGVMEHFERVLPKSQAEVSVVHQRLIRAGFRKDSAIKTFYGSKIVFPLSLCFIAFATGLAKSNFFFVYALCAGLGFLAPDFWLGKKISARQAQIRRGLPDVIDLMVICIEAGLSLDQATMRTAEELSRAHPTISDELGIVVLEQRAGRPRTEAWKHCAERTEVESLRNLASVLVQSEKFGTSVAKTLRVHADTLRTQRRQKVEEQAAKTTVKLVFPLVFFIFPSLFLVTIGPAAIVMVESFEKYLSH